MIGYATLDFPACVVNLTKGEHGHRLKTQEVHTFEALCLHALHFEKEQATFALHCTAATCELRSAPTPQKEPKFCDMNKLHRQDAK